MIKIKNVFPLEKFFNYTFIKKKGFLIKIAIFSDFKEQMLNLLPIVGQLFVCKFIAVRNLFSSQSKNIIFSVHLRDS